MICALSSAESSDLNEEERFDLISSIVQALIRLRAMFDFLLSPLEAFSGFLISTRRHR